MASLNTVSLCFVSILLLFVSPIISEVTTTQHQGESITYTSVAIVGAVFCKSCKFGAYNSSMDASPINGAIVKVTCYYSYRNPVSMAITTGLNGYFNMVWNNAAKFSRTRCRAYLGWSPFNFCKKPIYQNGSISAPLLFNGVQNWTRGFQSVYTSGVLMYGPTANNTLCHVP